MKLLSTLKNRCLILKAVRWVRNHHKSIVITRNVNSNVMKKQLLIVLGLCLTTASYAQISKVETFQIGTQIDYYIGECGNSIAEAQGKLSFCDRAGNLGVVEESLGLNGRGTLALIPNYYDDREVYVTRNGISMRKSDGSWENVPNVAFQRPILDSWNNTGSVTGGVLLPDGRLMLTVNQAGDYIHIYDVITKTLTLSSRAQTPTSNFPAVRKITYDPDTGNIYAFGLSGGNRFLWRYANDTFTLLNDSDIIFSAFPSSNVVTTLVKNGILYSGAPSGLYAIDLSNPLSVTKYDNTDTNLLPADRVEDLKLDANGNLWLALTSNNSSGITKFNPTTETFDFYSFEAPSGFDLKFKALAIDDTTVYATASNSGSLYDIDITQPEPTITEITDDNLDSLGVPITNTPSEIYNVGGEIFYITNDFSSGNTNNYEVLIRAGGSWRGRNDNAPGNISFRMINRFRQAYPTNDGGSWWINGFDDILVRIDGDDKLTPNLNFINVGDYGAVDTDQNYVGSLGIFQEGSKIRKVLEPTYYNLPTETTSGTRLVTQYKDQIWVFTPGDRTIEIYIDNNLIETITLEEGISFTSYFRTAVDSNGIFWSVKRLSSSVPRLIRYDRQADELSEITLANDFGIVREVIPSPDGGIWLISSTDVVYYKDGVEYGFPNDLFSFATIQDGEVDINGKLHIVTTGGINGDIHTVENPTAADPAITSVKLIGNTGVLPTENTSTTGNIIIDANGHYWVNSSRGFYKIIDDDTAPFYKTQGDTKGLITGRLFVDLNDNNTFDDGEEVIGQTVALNVNGEVREVLTDGTGMYTFFAQEENTLHKLILPSLGDSYFTDQRISEVTVNGLDVNYEGNDFQLSLKNYNSLLFKTASRTGVWGFDRDGFDNTFTTAISNMSLSKTFTDLDIVYLFKNMNDGALPEILDVKVTKLDANGVALLHNNITINPKNHRWSINIPSNQYTQQEVAINFTTTTTTGERRAIFTLPAIAPRETWVVEIETDLFPAEETGVTVVHTVESVGSPSFEDVPDDPILNDDVFVLYPEEDRDFNFVPLPSEDLNSPYIDPSDPAPDGTFIDPSEVYAPESSESPIFSSYDPNDKMVAGGNALKINDTNIDRKWLTYTIRFENTGNFSAKDVYILDALDDDIISDSFTLLEASHPVVVDFLPSGENVLETLRFSFNDIFLPFDDENNDGWVKFRVRVNDDIAEGTIVENTGAIYFDQNPPIITNTIQNRFMTFADTTAPRVNCQNITVALDENGSATITASDVDNASTDNEGVATVEVDIINFDCSNLGENQVILTVTDTSGNSASCYATVTVIDDIPPVAICKELTVFLDVNGEATIAADQINDGSTDNCDSLGYDLDQFSFTCDDIGENEVTLFVTDGSGNQSTCTAMVTVIDEIPPTANCSDITVALDENGVVTITPFDIDANDSFDTCSEVTNTISKDTFTCDDLGENTITFTTTDGSGNSATCTAIVTVVDDVSPVFDTATLPQDQSVDADDADMYIMEDFTIGITATDNCDDSVTYTQTPEEFEILSPDLYIVTITATDASGNETTYEFELDVRTTLSTTTFDNVRIIAYPNPVADVLHLQSPLPIDHTHVYDISGALVAKSTATNSIEVNHLAKGIYLVQIQSGAQTKTLKMIKK